MQPELIEGITRAVRASHAGEITFGDLVGELAAFGVERYHTDYTRQESTYYLPSGESMVLATPHPLHATADEFSASAVEGAVRQSQRNEHTYADFVKKTMAAGCVGYFVQIAGKQAQYFGRKGEIHIEHFPKPAADRP
jgi:uncharacterized protein YbcV (DUF1398 family)